MPATRKKKTRTLSYNARVGCLHVRQGSEEWGYWLDALAHDFGPAARCFRLTKIIPPQDGAPDHYDVQLTPDGNNCECMAHLYRGHKKPCRHVAALLCLLARNLIV